MVGYLRTFARHKGCEKKLPLLEDNMSLCERSFEVLAISADWGVDRILSRLLKELLTSGKRTKNELTAGRKVKLLLLLYLYEADIHVVLSI